MDALRTFFTRRTPQSQRADERQVENSAGGFVFRINDEARLRRFLTLGTDGGTYYARDKDLTRDNAEVVVRMALSDPTLLVDTIVAISVAGRAPKQNPALFALAAGASLADEAGRQYALAALPKVARTGTHLFLFARYVEQFRGWGRSLRRAISQWYTSMPVDALAYQVVKYRQREGWSHRDLLRLAHPVAVEPERRQLFDWIAHPGADSAAPLRPAVVSAYVEVQHATPSEAVGLIADHPLSWEMLPDRLLSEPDVWEALIDKGLPQTALMRQLPRLTRLGLAEGRSGKRIAAQLADPERLRKGRVHPVNVLIAQRTYASGRSARGAGTWTPVRRIVDALDAAFYAAFGAVEPTGKRLLLALDVSGSMAAAISGMPITAREASAALALVTAATEDDYEIVGFTGGGWAAGSAELSRLQISPRQRLDDVLAHVSNLAFGPTDCALPMLWATQTRREFDAFVVYTDNETWSGQIHPYQALRQYREQTGIPARLIVVGMTSTGFSIADPSDPGMLDIAGFDSAVPGLIADFASGR